MRTKFIRTRFLVGRSTQLKYLMLLMASILIPLVFVGGCLYYVIFTLIAERLGIPESIAYNLFPVIRQINMILLVGVPPLFLMLLAWGIMLSHRFVGPIQRLEKELENITKSGDYSGRISVRKNDEIRPIADAINKMLDKVEAHKR